MEQSFWSMPALWILALLVAMVAVAVLAVAWRASRREAAIAAEMARLGEATQRMIQQQAEAGGRLVEAQNTVSTRLEALGARLNDGLAKQTEKTGESLRDLQVRLAVIDSAQKRIAELSTQVVGLQDILSNKHARGSFGELQLEDLVRQALPPSAFDFQVTLGNRARADCIIILPNPPGPIAIDAKFPLESYRALRAATDDAGRIQAGRAFAADVGKHVKDIAERYIVPGETADGALMFLPAEAVYAELHANFGNVVEDAFRRRVYIVSPTTLMATLNTVRAVLKDSRMREHTGRILDEVQKLLKDVGRLDERVEKLQAHFGQADADIRQILISTGKVMKRADTIESMQIEEVGAAEALKAPEQTAKLKITTDTD
ncbi:MAG: DNA recombination protein RmuC [Proteobacteria bacterium]|nr:DNA recombination protein RmuC [Pseudomonadota bacterium]